MSTKASGDCPHPKKHKNDTPVLMDDSVPDITKDLKELFAKAQECLKDKADKTNGLVADNENVNIQQIIKTFKTLQEMINKCEETLKTQVLAIEQKNKPSIEEYLKSIDSKQQSLSSEIGKFEKMVSTKNDVQLLQDKTRLTTFLQQFQNELSALKPPTKIDYCIDEVDQLEAKITDLFNQACVTEFAAPGTYAQLDCKGRHCAKCGKCRDWYYTGDLGTWIWIISVKNWDEEERKRRDNGNYSQRFKRRTGYTCEAYYGYYYDRYHPYYGPHISFSCGYFCNGCGCPLLYRSDDCCGSGVRNSFHSGVYHYCQCSDNVKINV